jgi:anti-sigma B factor antagonist
MNATTGNLYVWAQEGSACVRVTGRASFTTSVDFKKLMQHLRDSGCRRVALDLSDCVLMDSTFLGVLANEARKYAAEGETASPGCLEIVNPNQRIRDLIDNLGVADRFKIVQYELAKEDFKPVQPATGVSREEVTRTCLEAHEILMALNPANIPKFKDVVQFFAENLKKKGD